MIFCLLECASTGEYKEWCWFCDCFRCNNVLWVSAAKGVEMNGQSGDTKMEEWNLILDRSVEVLLRPYCFTLTTIEVSLWDCTSNIRSKYHDTCEMLSYSDIRKWYNRRNTKESSDCNQCLYRNSGWAFASITPLLGNQGCGQCFHGWARMNNEWVLSWYELDERLIDEGNLLEENSHTLIIFHREHSNGWIYESMFEPVTSKTQYLDVASFKNKNHDVSCWR